MLLMKPSCECCDRDLPADNGAAFICSFECTFCENCTVEVLNGKCPNCAGALFRRPTRVGPALTRNPAFTDRVYRPGKCAEAGLATG